MDFWRIYICTIFVVQLKISYGYLYPYESETREIRSLNGLWQFKISPESNMDIGYSDLWYKKDFIELGDYMKMPVPASFNDISTNSTIRDFIGWVWYQHSFYAPQRWLEDNVRVFLHFGSVHYYADVFLNGHNIGEHQGGHLPFQLELPKDFMRSHNTLTVAVNNTLTPTSIPQGRLYYPNDTSRYPPGYKLYSHDFDYFDYAGINRPVILFTTPKIHIKGIYVLTDIEKEIGQVSYTVLANDQEGKAQCRVKLYDKTNLVAQSDLCQAKLFVHNAQFWWPVKTCNKPPGYLYTLEVTLSGVESDPDVYRLPVGIRTVSWTNSSLLINNEPVYLRGFGMHEDANIRGRGFDNAVMARDLNLINWIGANAIRTSHYPYAEEMLNEADASGILVILEAPACSLKGFGEKLYNSHKAYMTEMMEVHRNRPSVIMWSLANEPVSNSVEANYYFGNLSQIVKQYDKTRPITFVTSQQVLNETAVQHVDVVCVNRYRGWYTDSGHTDLIVHQVSSEISAWHQKYSKPVIVSEYGAGSIAGLHTLPASMWSEDYQSITHLEHFEAFNSLKAGGRLAGEMMWNFIDFNTPQEYIRPGRCSKGLFTRERQPKQAAYVVRGRYQTINNCSDELQNCQDNMFL